MSVFLVETMTNISGMEIYDELVFFFSACGLITGEVKSLTTILGHMTDTTHGKKLFGETASYPA